jgi:hypothetical protein
MSRTIATLALVCASIALGLSTAQQASAEPDCGDGPWTPEMGQCLINGSSPASQQKAVWAYKHGNDVCDFFQLGGVNINALTQAKTYLTGTIGFSPAETASVVTSSVLWNCPEYSMAVGNIN